MQPTSRARTRHRGGRLGALWLLAIPGLLFLVACGGGGESDFVDGEAAPNSTSARAKVSSLDVDRDGRPEIVVSSDDAHTVFAVGSSARFEDVTGALGGEAAAATAFTPDLGASLALLPFTSADDEVGAVLHDGWWTEDTADAPAITSVQPTQVERGDVVWIEGTGFHTPREAAQVLLGDQVLDAIFVLARFIAVQVPEDAALGASELLVRREGLDSGSVTITVVEAGTPVVTQTSPSPLVRGRLAMVEGEHLGRMGEHVTVTINGQTVESVFAFRELLLMIVPASATDGDLVITRESGQSVTTAVEVADAPMLSLGAVRPNEAPVGSLVALDLVGMDFGFGFDVSVQLGETELSIWEINPGGMLVIVPEGAESGDITVSMSGQTTAGVALTIRDRELPSIAEVDPDPVVPGDFVNVRGVDLYDLSGWTFPKDPGDFDEGFFDFPEPAHITFNGERTLLAFPTEDGVMALVPPTLAGNTVSIVVHVGDEQSAAFEVDVESAP